MFLHLSVITSYKPVCASSTLLLFLKITTTIMIQYVVVGKSAQPIKEEKLFKLEC